MADTTPTEDDVNLNQLWWILDQNYFTDSFFSSFNPPSMQGKQPKDHIS